MSEIDFLPGGLAVPDLARVATDQKTITGSGAADDPLVAIGGSIPIVVDGVTIVGDGTTIAPLMVSPGGLADRIAVAVDGVTITGDGTTENPLISHAAGAGAILVDYVATGAEGIDFFIAIATLTPPLAITWCSVSGAVPQPQFPNGAGDRTTNHFRVTLTAPLNVGDQITFIMFL